MTNERGAERRKEPKVYIAVDRLAAVGTSIDNDEGS
jgi:hypothetical protein